MKKDFDETILDNEENFKKRFRIIDRKDIPIAAINKALQESKKEHSEITEAEKNKKDYEYLENSEEASKRGLKRITRPDFLGEPNKKETKGWRD